MQVPITQAKSKEHEALTPGESPEGWTSKRLNHTDIDARWTKEHGKNYDGYKVHANSEPLQARQRKGNIARRAQPRQDRRQRLAWRTGHVPAHRARRGARYACKVRKAGGSGRQRPRPAAGLDREVLKQAKTGQGCWFSPACAAKTGF